MIIMSLRDLFDQLQGRWTAWWAAAFPSVVPFPELPEIPGRDALLAQLEERRKTQARETAARHESMKALLVDLNEAQQKVDRLQQQLTEHHQAEWLASSLTATEIERLQTLISEKAPITLSMFVEEMDSELTRLRRMEPTVIPSGSDRNYSLMKKTMRFQTNAGSIKRRVEALQKAREQAIDMQTESMTVREILDEVYRLRKGLPEIRDEETRGPLAAAVLGL